MKFRQRSQVALASSITIHLLLLVVLSVLGAFSILDKKDKPAEIFFFDSVNAGGSSGGSLAAPPAAQPTISSDNNDTQAIADNTTKTQTAYTPPVSLGQSASDNQSGTGVGVGSGSGAGTGSGSGTGSSDGVGSGSGISSNPSVPPRVARYVAPDYPSAARGAGITGVVKLQVLINSSGDVQGAEVYESSGSQSLDNAAVRAVRSWQFTAAKDSAGRRVACYTIVPIRFNLKN